MPGRKSKLDLEKAVRDVVDDSIESEGIVDIFKVAGIDKADISILDDRFLQTFKNKEHPNLRLKPLQKLIADEIKLRQKRNLAKARSFRDLLEATLQKYHNRLIDAAAVIQAMLKIKQEMGSDDERAGSLGLSEEELAFYDAVVENYKEIYEPLAKCSILAKIKEGKDFNRRNTRSILRIKI